MKNLLLIFILFVLISGCKQPPEPQLPPATQEGKNILGCRINGEIFFAEGILDRGFSFSQRTGAYFSRFTLSGDTIFEIGAEARNPKEADVVLTFKYNPSENIFELDGAHQNEGRVETSLTNEPLSEATFRTDDLRKGSVIITQYTNEIIAGTFEFEAIDSRGEIVRVTDGRFDLSNKR